MSAARASARAARPWHIGSYYNRNTSFKVIPMPRKLDHKSPFMFWDEHIKLYPSGVSRKRISTRLRDSSFTPAVRGNITYFSRHSALRLRRALVELSPPSDGYIQLGITLTVPWNVAGFSDDRLAADYKIAFNRFSTAFRRRFPHSLAIFRHELQKRRAPHSHIVLWLSRIDFDFVHRGRTATSSIFRSIVLGFWSKAVFGSNSSECFVYPVKSLSGFHRKGIKVDCLKDSLSMFRYIADHASKHKKSQLGYQGKQWGFINRKLFVPAKSFNVEFRSQSQYIIFFRHVSKLSRYIIDCGKPSQRLSRRSDGKSVIFLNERSSNLIGDSVFSGLVCSDSEIPQYVFIRLWWPLLFCLFSLAWIHYHVQFALCKIFSRNFVICSLLPHINIYETINKKIYF